ncbi:hypothetical protein EGW08_011029, partial [Elysia chlorotica]
VKAASLLLSQTGAQFPQMACMAGNVTPWKAKQSGVACSKSGCKTLYRTATGVIRVRTAVQRTPKPNKFLPPILEASHPPG